MSPKAVDPSTRTDLVEAAARVLASEGPRALTSRRLAAEVGTSTMAVYTYLGGMDGVRRAVRQEGFSRLTAYLDAVPPSEDSVADLVACGAAYLTNGLTNPHLYRVMFSEGWLDEEEAAVGLNTFQRLIDAVHRCTEAGRFHRADCRRRAVQLWTMMHGMVSLALAGLLPAEEIPHHAADMSLRLFIGYGDDPTAAERSVNRALRHYQQPPVAD